MLCSKEKSKQIKRRSEWLQKLWEISRRFRRLVEPTSSIQEFPFQIVPLEASDHSKLSFRTERVRKYQNPQLLCGPFWLRGVAGKHQQEWGPYTAKTLVRSNRLLFQGSREVMRDSRGGLRWRWPCLKITNNMYVCMHAYIHTYLPTYLHTYIDTYIHTYIHAYMHTCIHASMHPCIHAYMHTCIHAYMHTCIHAYMHTCIHAYMHTCIHASMHTCIHAYMHTCIHAAYMHTCIHAYMHTCIHAYMHTCIHAYMHTCIHAYIVYVQFIYIYSHVIIQQNHLVKKDVICPKFGYWRRCPGFISLWFVSGESPVIRMPFSMLPEPPSGTCP